jgi:hypothetical protein
MRNLAHPVRATTVAIIVVIAALLGAAAAYTAASPSAKLAKQDRVWGGGQFGPGCDLGTGTSCIVIPRNLAVDAHAESDGSGAAGNSTYALSTSRSVTCMKVDGNSAVIGGVIEVGGAVGWGYVQYFVDRGTSDLSSPQHDLASLTGLAPLTAPDPSWPVGFPYICPPATGTPGFPAPYFEMDRGDIVVQDATTK